jgi:4-oxalmesaconate hydratase
MVGAVRGIDPESGHYYDDTKRYIDAAAISDLERQKIFEGNVRWVYPRINERIPMPKAQGSMLNAQ